MTQATGTVQLSGPRSARPPQGFPRFSFGQQVEAICSAIMKANTMAYLAPFTAMGQMPSIATEADLGGRNPNW